MTETHEAQGFTQGWHIQKSVPLALIVVLLVHTLGIVVWGVRLDSRMAFVEGETAALQLESARITADLLSQERVQAISVSDVRERLARIETLLESIEKRSGG